MGSQPVVRAVILDLDNTLYDWVAYFVPAIRAMIEHASRQLRVDTDSLRDDLRQVHVRYGNTEHPFALLETRTVEQKLPGLTVREKLDVLRPAFDAFNEVRSLHLRLYPTVATTLGKIKDTGCRIVGHTEATDVNIASRTRALGLRYWLEAIYAPRFAGPPHPLGRDRAAAADPVTLILLPSSARKPDPRVARQIASSLDVPYGQCLYVGDSQAKDVAMAKRAGLLAAWARYGARHDVDLWTELVRVSHWDSSAVAAAESIGAPTEADVVLDSFHELLEQFKFRDGAGRSSPAYDH